MAHIVGYTRKKWPKWPYVVFVLFVLFVILVLFLFTLSKSAEKKTVPTTTTTTTTTTMVMPTTTSSTTIPKSTLIPWFKNREEPEEEEEAKIRVEKIIFTSGIDEFNRNIDSFKEIPVERAERVFCYTVVNSSDVPAVIRHVWFAPNDSLVADIKLDIFNINANTWSYINLSGAPAGEWKVVIKTAEGRKIGENKFLLYQ